MHWRQLRRPTVLFLVAAISLLWLALRQVTFYAIWQLLGQLEGRQLLNLVALNGLILMTMVGRWWLLLLAQGYNISLGALLRYRLAAFGLTYFTPGPQFGGEPLQVYLVYEHHNVPLHHAIAAVTLDKMVEMAVNFAFLVCGITFLLNQGILYGLWTYGAIALAILLLAFPLLLFGAYFYGKRPLHAIIDWHEQHKFKHIWLSPGWLGPLLAAAIESENQAILLCREQPWLLVGTLLITLFGWGMMVVEFGYATHLLGTDLTLSAVIGVMVAARVAYLLPMPAGVGTFESALALAFHWLTHDPATGLALSVLIRSRDLLLGGIGLWLGGMALDHHWRPTMSQVGTQLGPRIFNFYKSFWPTTSVRCAARFVKIKRPGH
ncbi:MAG: flippase-like domain-containing protein [Caldilineaceae bacterium]|nr:flippase-like domain-containing protein [Caldilineaceae bacterium]